MATKGRFLRLTATTRRHLETDTRRIRTDLLTDLKRMFDEAKQAAAESANKPPQAQAWVRVMGYIGQVINCLARSFEEAKALEQIEKLEKMINAADTEENQ